MMSSWTLGNTDLFFYFFLTFYRPNNQSIKHKHYRLINWRKIVISCNLTCVLIWNLIWRLWLILTDFISTLTVTEGQSGNRSTPVCLEGRKPLKPVLALKCVSYIKTDSNTKFTKSHQSHAQILCDEGQLAFFFWTYLWCNRRRIYVTIWKSVLWNIFQMSQKGVVTHQPFRSYKSTFIR